MRVIAFYTFFELKDAIGLKKEIKNFFKDIVTKGNILVGPEGLNGTIAVPELHEQKTINFLKEIGVKENHIKYSNFDSDRFFKKKLKVKIKKEIVTSNFNLSVEDIKKGQFVDPKNWENFISQDDVTIIDTRNEYEFKMGHFKNAINPKIESFREFKNYIDANKDKLKNKKVAIYCTGGIRCEKAGPLMQKLGIDTFQLKGGILKYFEETSAPSWDGECFVFDYRVSVDKNLKPGNNKLCYGCNMPLTKEEVLSPHYKEGFTCPNCYKQLTDKKKRSLTDKREHWKRIS
ncbi:rhodanese-like domain-containing protein [Alphaproteobacteria bacterium]|nr:rhodanese-like domain-containing protein [Alphaproteobacteria bacterium]